jgi:hypothetical protein
MLPAQRIRATLTPEVTEAPVLQLQFVRNSWGRVTGGLFTRMHIKCRAVS